VNEVLQEVVEGIAAEVREKLGSVSIANLSRTSSSLTSGGVFR
jgi:hypothetical protein